MENPIRFFFDLGFRQSVKQRPSGTRGGPQPTEDTSHDEARARRSEPTAAQSAAPVWRVGALLGSTAALVLVIAVAALALFVALPMRAPPDAATDYPAAAGSPIVLYATILVLGGAIALVLAATLLHFLRRLENPTYWESACWILVVFGIFARQLTSAGDHFAFSIGALAVSAVVGLAILPGTMRWLNRIPRRPGLAHVAVPFSLGFFVDLAQVLTTKYVVQLPWLSQ